MHFYRGEKKKKKKKKSRQKIVIADSRRFFGVFLTKYGSKTRFFGHKKGQKQPKIAFGYEK
jgi:hypothetical protein